MRLCLIRMCDRGARVSEAMKEKTIIGPERTEIEKTVIRGRRFLTFNGTSPGINILASRMTRGAASIASRDRIAGLDEIIRIDSGARSLDDQNQSMIEGAVRISIEKKLGL